MAASLSEHRGDAALYKRLATLRLDVPLAETLDQLRWEGVPKLEYQTLCTELGFGGLMDLPSRWTEGTE